MISLFLIILSSLFFVGIIDKTKSKLSGRKGASILQPLKDIIRLFRKGSVYSPTTSFIFKIASPIYFSTIIVAALIIPFGKYGGLISFNGDFIMFAYILGLGKFFNIISSLDTGSSFEGMGASREGLMSMLAEPSFFILIGTISLLGGESTFLHLFSSIHHSTITTPIIAFFIIIMGSFIFFMLALIESSRMPIDDPKTHLELTMIHEVMILDNSGFDLALIHLAGAIKFTIYGTLIANLWFIGDMNILIAIPVFLMVQFLFAVVIGISESFIARFRINQNPQFIFSLSSIAFLIFIGVTILLGRFN